MQAILNLGFTAGNDPFLGPGFFSKEQCTKKSMYMFSGMYDPLMPVPKSDYYEVFRFFIKSYKDGWQVVDMLTGLREIVYNIADIKITLDKMKKAQDAL